MLTSLVLDQTVTSPGGLHLGNIPGQFWETRTRAHQYSTAPTHRVSVILNSYQLNHWMMSTK